MLEFFLKLFYEVIVDFSNLDLKHLIKAKQTAKRKRYQDSPERAHSVASSRPLLNLPAVALHSLRRPRLLALLALHFRVGPDSAQAHCRPLVGPTGRQPHGASPLRRPRLQQHHSDAVQSLHSPVCPSVTRPHFTASNFFR